VRRGELVDKYEYNLRKTEFLDLYNANDLEKAADVAAKVNWAKVKDWGILSKVITTFDEVGRIEDAKEVSMYAYNRRLGGRRLVYKLCELLIRCNDLENAMTVYNEYRHIAPNDISHYTLLYRYNVASGASIEKLIGILEEYNHVDRDEHCLYELACLYEQAGRINECMATCDEIILWFNGGEYYESALLLKRRHGALTHNQKMMLERIDSIRNSDMNAQIKRRSVTIELPNGAVRPEDIYKAATDQLDYAAINEQLNESTNQVQNPNVENNYEQRYDVNDAAYQDYDFGGEDSRQIIDAIPEESRFIESNPMPIDESQVIRNNTIKIPIPNYNLYDTTVIQKDLAESIKPYIDGEEEHPLASFDAFQTREIETANTDFEEISKAKDEQANVDEVPKSEKKVQTKEIPTSQAEEKPEATKVFTKEEREEILNKDKASKQDETSISQIFEEEMVEIPGIEEEKPEDVSETQLLFKKAIEKEAARPKSESVVMEYARENNQDKINDDPSMNTSRIIMPGPNFKVEKSPYKTPFEVDANENITNEVPADLLDALERTAKDTGVFEAPKVSDEDYDKYLSRPINVDEIVKELEKLDNKESNVTAINKPTKESKAENKIEKTIDTAILDEVIGKIVSYEEEAVKLNDVQPNLEEIVEEKAKIEDEVSEELIEETVEEAVEEVELNLPQEEEVVPQVEENVATVAEDELLEDEVLDIASTNTIKGVSEAIEATGLKVVRENESSNDLEGDALTMGLTEDISKLIKESLIKAGFEENASIEDLASALDGTASEETEKEIKDKAKFKEIDDEISKHIAKVSEENIEGNVEDDADDDEEDSIEAISRAAIQREEQLEEEINQRYEKVFLECFKRFANLKGVRKQVFESLDAIENKEDTKTSKSGNLVVTGNKDVSKTDFAVAFVKTLNLLHPENKRKIAKVSSDSLNKRGISNVMDKLYGAVLIIAAIAYFIVRRKGSAE